MRRLWTRKSRSRLFLVVAAVSVTTLAVYSAVSGWHGVGHASASAVAAASGTSSGSGDCSKATARQVATRFQLNDQVAQVFCGAFVGPGSQAMVVAFTPGTCGINGWAVFSLTGGAWQLVGSPHVGWTIALTAVGSDIRETAPVPTGNFQCPTSGRARTRIWHWDGSSLVAGPWKQLTKGEPEPRAFHSPSGGIQCGMGDARSYRGVACHSLAQRRPVIFNAVTMDARGGLKTCRGSAARCRLGDVGDVPTLGYGRQVTVGRFRCLSRRTGVRCTVIQSGKGFLINRSGVRRVGP
jgi:hypothetical protein